MKNQTKEKIIERVVDLYGLTVPEAERIAEIIIRNNKAFNSVNRLSLPSILKSANDHPTMDIFERLDLLLQIKSSITFDSCIMRYGETEGTLKWELYKNKQSETNSFEYKHQKYGMTREEFDEYNKSRAVTVENLISRHGEEKGTEIWKKYCEQQSYTKTKDYYIDNHGEVEGTRQWDELCKKKALTIENFERKYGKENGEAMYKKKVIDTHALRGFVSEASNRFFDAVYEIIGEDHREKSYSGRHSIEFGIMGNKRDGLFRYDFAYPEIDLIVEYNGVHYHAKPSIYQDPTQNVIVPCNPRKVGNIWDRDRAKLEAARKRNFDVFVVWEDEDLSLRATEIANEILKRLKNGKDDS